MTKTNPTLPAPEIMPEVARFWEAAGDGELVLRHCRSCDKSHHYPRTFCPFCYCDDLDWNISAGTGKIYSFSIMRRAPEPFAIAYVSLDEGVTMLSHVVGCDLDAIKIGQTVEVEFVSTTGDGPKVPVFRPVPSPAM